MRYTYLFTQISREENGELVSVTETDKPYEFVFTFGKNIKDFLSENPVLLTKDMWKENPATNSEILPTVCFSAPSLKGYTRPLVMTKEADKRVGLYRYKEVVGSPIDLKKGQYLSDKIRTLTKIFVEGVKVMNEDAFIRLEDLENANVKHLMSYIKSEVYKYLLQDRDNLGKKRSEEFLKNVLVSFFSIIPDSIIAKFDEGLEAHDEIRGRLEGVPQNNNEDTIRAILKSQGYFKTYDDFKLFVVLHKYILSVKNVFNHFVWVMYRSKIGLVSLKKVKQQLSALFEFVIVVQDNCAPLENKGIVKYCSAYRKEKYVEGFLNELFMQCEVQKKDKSYQAALCYLFQEECHHKYLNARYKCWDDIDEEIKIRHQEEFKDLCLRYWGINEPNSYKPNQCKKQKEEIRKLYEEIWERMRKYHQ